MMRNLICALFITLALPAYSDTLRPVITGHAEKVPAKSGTFIGTIEASVTVGVAFEVLGRITSRPVNEGDQVTAGQILATIDAQSLQDNRDAARAALQGAEAQLVTAENALDRARELVNRGSESADALEAAERNALVARAQADQARAQLARAEDGVTRAELTAPMDGIVIMTRHDPGTTVAAGDPVLVLASPKGRKARLTLPAALIEKLALGAPFTLFAPELPPEGIMGTLLRVDPVSVSETRMREAEIAIPAHAERLSIGQLVEVRAAMGGADVIAIPSEAIFEVEGKSYVWTVETRENRRFAKRLEVTRGEATGDGRHAVTGLDIGAEVVLRGVQSLTDGQELGAAGKISSRSSQMPLIVGAN